MWNLLILDDNEDNCNTIALALEKNTELEISKSYDPLEALQIVERQNIDMIISDFKMPNMDGITFIKQVLKKHPQTVCLILTAFGTVENAVEAIKLGAFDYMTKPINLKELRCVVNKGIKHLSLLEENQRLRQEVKAAVGNVNFIFKSVAMKQIYDFIKEIAPSRSPILIEGESGVGKEVVAKAIHQLSSRQDQEFLTINCAAINETLLESELFGHEKGSFTGATALKKGFFEVADEGTLFLDEIGEMSMNIQSKILRVIEYGEFYRIGSTRPMKTNIRLVAATNKKLHDEVGSGNFRQDLFYRLNVFSLTLPPLRERKNDIPVLFDFFISQYSKSLNKEAPPVTSEVYEVLKSYDWPGNVRELKNLSEYIMVLNKGKHIDPESLPNKIVPKAQESSKDHIHFQVGSTISDVEKEMILKTLENCNFNRTKSAQILGISRRTLIRKLQDFELDSKSEK